VDWSYLLDALFFFFLALLDVESVAPAAAAAAGVPFFLSFFVFSPDFLAARSLAFFAFAISYIGRTVIEF
jgi:hypothetical protein